MRPQTLISTGGLALGMAMIASNLGSCAARPQPVETDPSAGLAAFMEDRPRSATPTRLRPRQRELDQQISESVRMLDELFNRQLAEDAERTPANDPYAHVEIDPPAPRAGTPERTPGAEPAPGPGDSGGGIQETDRGGSAGLRRLARGAIADVSEHAEGGSASLAGLAEAEPPAPDEPARPEPTPAQRRSEFARNLATLVEQMAVESDDPARAGLALAALELVEPGALDSLLAAGVLSQTEANTLEGVRRLLLRLRDDEPGLDPGAAADAMDDIRDELEQLAGLRIARVALCTRVEDFGKYTPFERNVFVAGVAQPVIVYVEVERFAQRPIMAADGNPRYEVALSQRLELYHEADDLLAFAKPAQTDRAVDYRGPVRDYYLIHMVRLPKNLTVGKYKLKVIMEDEIGRSSAETIIPFEIVAGPGVASAGTP